MEAYLNENFGDVKPKNSSYEALAQWRKLCGVVRNPKRRFRFTANLSKRYEAADLSCSIQEKFRVAVLVSKAAFRFIHVPEAVKAAGFGICADGLGFTVGGHNLKLLRYHGGVDGIAEKLSTSTSDGISADNYLLNRRREIYGVNKFAESGVFSFWTFVWEALQDMILIVDSVCAFVTLLLGIMMAGWQEKVHDAIEIFISISMVVFINAINDYWQSSEFRNWEKKKKKFMVQVTRNGFRQKLSSENLLPGEIVHLASGDKVPADGLFVSGSSMLLDESDLAGDTEPVMVNSGNPFMISGSKVLDGSCKMMVTTVGMRTQWGKLMETLSQVGEDETPVQVKLNGVAAIIGKIGGMFAVVTFAVLMQGLLNRKLQGTLWSWSAYDALEMFKYLTIAFTVFAIALPEGLPLAMTLNLAFSMKKIMNDRSLIRHLAACETMGLATNICIDMTAILTSNSMTVAKLCIGNKVRAVSEHHNVSSFCSEIPDSALKLLLQSIFNNTDGEVLVNKYRKLEVLGTPTETALLNFALSLGGVFPAERRAAELVKFEPFNSTKKQMRVLLRLPGGHLRAHCKGASEIVLTACDKMIDSNGETIAFNEASVNYLKVTISQFADEGLQTLCFAYKEMEDGFSGVNPIPAFGYTCIAIVGIKDPIRPGIKESIAVCRSAGISIRMITGDNLNAATAIARQCGILTDDGIAIEGPDIREKTQEELLQLIPRIQVMAEAAPLDKHTLVKILKTTFNEVVAVTGGGINDPLSLNEADIGLAMGISGTEVAKESADIIILDDNFSTIVTMAARGRSIVMNVKKFVQFQLTVTLVASILNISSAWLKGITPFSYIELLWIGLITDTLVAFALATEPLDSELMMHPPVGKKENFITDIMWKNIIGQSFYQVSIMWYLQSKGNAILQLDDPDSDLILDTFIFNAFIFCQVSNLISSRKIKEINVFKGILNNYIFVIVLCCIVLFEITIIEFLNRIANTSPLTMSQWFFSVFIGLLGIPVAAGAKMIAI